MPAASPRELAQAIVDAIADSGCIGLIVPGTPANPHRFLVASEGESFSLWTYVWTLTPGGRPALPNEYRIQMTSVDSPLPENPNGLTVLIGYEPDLRMFAGFDLQRHRVFAPGSPSVQIDITAVHRALQDGLAYIEKANNKIAIGVRPDHLLFYCHHASELHEAGSDAIALKLLRRASGLENISAAELTPLPPERERVVEEVTRLARSANFRAQVLQAYANRCAVTRAQLRLVEAAHILPVAAGPNSIDVIGNGIALSPTYHRALDRGLIYLGEDLEMRLNQKQAAQLREVNQGEGLHAFQHSLGRIHLPPDRRQWPDGQFIRLANQYRNIS